MALSHPGSTVRHAQKSLLQFVEQKLANGQSSAGGCDGAGPMKPGDDRETSPDARAACTEYAFIHPGNLSRFAMTVKKPCPDEPDSLIAGHPDSLRSGTTAIRKASRPEDRRNGSPDRLSRGPTVRRKAGHPGSRPNGVVYRTRNAW